MPSTQIQNLITSCSIDVSQCGDYKSFFTQLSSISAQNIDQVALLDAMIAAVEYIPECSVEAFYKALEHDFIDKDKILSTLFQKEDKIPKLVHKIRSCPATCGLHIKYALYFLIKYDYCDYAGSFLRVLSLEEAQNLSHRDYFFILKSGIENLSIQLCHTIIAMHNGKISWDILYINEHLDVKLLLSHPQFFADEDLAIDANHRKYLPLQSWSLLHQLALRPTNENKSSHDAHMTIVQMIFTHLADNHCINYAIGSSLTPLVVATNFADNRKVIEQFLAFGANVCDIAINNVIASKENLLLDTLLKKMSAKACIASTILDNAYDSKNTIAVCLLLAKGAKYQHIIENKLSKYKITTDYNISDLINSYNSCQPSDQAILFQYAIDYFLDQHDINTAAKLFHCIPCYQISLCRISYNIPRLMLEYNRVLTKGLKYLSADLDENNIILAQLHLESPIFSYYFQYDIFLKLKKVFPEFKTLDVRYLDIEAYTKAICADDLLYTYRQQHWLRILRSVNSNAPNTALSLGLIANFYSQDYATLKLYLAELPLEATLADLYKAELLKNVIPDNLIQNSVLKATHTLLCALAAENIDTNLFEKIYPVYFLMLMAAPEKTNTAEYLRTFITHYDSFGFFDKTYSSHFVSLFKQCRGNLQCHPHTHAADELTFYEHMKFLYTFDKFSHFTIPNQDVANNPVLLPERTVLYSQHARIIENIVNNNKSQYVEQLNGIKQTIQSGSQLRIQLAQKDEEYKQEITNLQHEITNLQKERSELSAQFLLASEFKPASSSPTVDVQKLKTREKSLQKENNALRAKCKNAESENAEQKKFIAKLERANETMENNNKDLLTSISFFEEQANNFDQKAEKNSLDMARHSDCSTQTAPVIFNEMVNTMIQCISDSTDELQQHLSQEYGAINPLPAQINSIKHSLYTLAIQLNQKSLILPKYYMPGDLYAFDTIITSFLNYLHSKLNTTSNSIQIGMCDYNAACYLHAYLTKTPVYLTCSEQPELNIRVNADKEELGEFANLLSIWCQQSNWRNYVEDDNYMVKFSSGHSQSIVFNICLTAHDKPYDSYVFLPWHPESACFLLPRISPTQTSFYFGQGTSAHNPCPFLKDAAPLALHLYDAFRQTNTDPSNIIDLLFRSATAENILFLLQNYLTQYLHTHGTYIFEILATKLADGQSLFAKLLPNNSFSSYDWQYFCNICSDPAEPVEVRMAILFLFVLDSPDTASEDKKITFNTFDEKTYMFDFEKKEYILPEKYAQLIASKALEWQRMKAEFTTAFTVS